MDELRLFSCACSDAALSVYHDPEDADYPYISLSFWRWGHGGSAYDRLRHIVYILCYGHPYEDEIILTPESANYLSAHLWCIVKDLKRARVEEQA